MVPFLYTPREHHCVKTPEAYRAKHAAFLAKKAAAGQQFAVHEIATPIVARIDANTWLVDCDCGNGVATDPDWGLACCFGCGAVYVSVQFPEAKTREAIETELLARPRTGTRNWLPTEDVADLVHENASHGIVSAGLERAE